MRIKLIATSVLFAACGTPALAEPLPTPPSAQTPVLSSPPIRGAEEEVWHTVQDWAAAWSARDAFSFLAFYAKGFQPEDGSNFADWSSRRRIYFRQTKLVEVTVTFPAIRMIDDKHAKVRFTQSIRTGQIQSLDEKTMSLTKVGGLWMISEEQSLASRIDPIAHTKLAEAPAPVRLAPIVQSAPVETVPVAPQPPSQPQVQSTEEVWAVIQAWAQAWRAKDAAAFFGHYGTRFRPNDGSSLDAWQKRRRDYFAKVKSIQIDLTEQTIEFTGTGRAEVRFTQDFRSDVFKEISRKQLTLENVNGLWRIVTEQADPRLAEYQIAKMEAAKVEAARAEAARAEAARAEAARAEAARAEAARAEAARAEAARAEAARAEAVRAEAVRAEAVRAEAVRAEAVRAEAARAEAAHAEAAHAEATRADAAKTGAGTTEASSAPPETHSNHTRLGLEAWSTVQSWAQAWGSLNADAFIGHYGASFAPEDGSPRAAWEARRRDYFKRVKYIEIGLNDPVIHVSDESHAQIKFEQSFRSDIYREVAKPKFLALEKVNGRWIIMAEQTDASNRQPSAVAHTETERAQEKAEASRTEAAKAEALRAKAAQAQADAARAKAETEAEQARVRIAAAQAETERAKAEAAQAKTKAEADAQAAREKAEMARADVARADALKAEANRAKSEAAKARAAAEAEQAKARVEIAKAEQARAEAARAEATKARADAARAKAEANAETARRKAAEAQAASQAYAETTKSVSGTTVVAQTTVTPQQTQGIHDLIGTWAKAWASRDVAAYLACYGEHFQPAGGESFAAWEAQRRARIGKATTIEIGVDDLSVELLDGDYAKARFTQRYRSDNYRDVVSKTVILEKAGTEWRIVREEASAPVKSTARR